MIGGNRLNSRKQRAYDTILPPTGIYPYFTKVGAAFRGKEDGKYAYRIVLDALPINGELILFEPKERNQTET